MGWAYPSVDCIYTQTQIYYGTFSFKLLRTHLSGGSTHFVASTRGLLYPKLTYVFQGVSGDGLGPPVGGGGEPDPVVQVGGACGPDQVAALAAGPLVPGHEHNLLSSSQRMLVHKECSQGMLVACCTHSDDTLDPIFKDSFYKVQVYRWEWFGSLFKFFFILP